MEVVSPTVRALQRQGVEDPERLGADAAQRLPWFRPWDRVLEWDPPTFRWFLGAQTNLSYNCLDRHVAAGRGGHTALIALNERGERREYTYAQLLDAVTQLAAALRGLGIRKGDRIAIYMPTCPEAMALMLAAARIGAIHLVVFAGFGSGALGERLRLSGARALFTTDVTYRKGRDVRLKEIVDDAVNAAGQAVERGIVLGRTGDEPLHGGRH